MPETKTPPIDVDLERAQDAQITHAIDRASRLCGCRPCNLAAKFPREACGTRDAILTKLLAELVLVAKGIEARREDGLLRWMIRHLAHEQAGSKPSGVVLGHVGARGAVAPMDCFELGTHDEHTARSITSQLRYLALCDAEVRGASSETYSVHLSWPSEKTEPIYHAFSVDGSEGRLHG